MKSLYLAPMNYFSNYIYRNFILSLGADFVFSELIMVDRLDEEMRKNKLKLLSEKDLERTIFQIGVRNKEEVVLGVETLKKIHPSLKEININVGCPQSTMQKNLVCSGLLFDETLMKSLFEELVLLAEKLNFIPSIKIRLGLSPDEIRIKHYLSICKKVGIKKVYIHARSLRYNYSKPALYDSFIGLKNEFPDIELIFNGDVDSYERYNQLVNLGADGVMIGRAALSNPEIFLQIKNKKEVRSKNYDPFLNDLNLIVENGHWILSEHKKDLIKKFLQLVLDENLVSDEKVSFSVIKTHVLYFFKGLSNRSKLINSVRESKSIEDLIKIIKFILVGN